MKYPSLLVVIFVALPHLAHAQSFQAFFRNLLTFIDAVVIPFILGLAFVFFVINVVRYFILGSTTDEGRENAKNLALYSVLAFFTIIIFWGVVNMLSSSIGLQGKAAPTPDYFQANP